MDSVGQFLTANDLALPAKELPSKVLFDLGHMLHQPQYSSGSWEMVAEELGYTHDDIKRFATMATVHQRGTPGEQMLRNWVDKATGCTLYVLCNALENIGRKDCMEYLKTEIYNRVVYMDLMICIRNDSNTDTEHRKVKTRTDATLHDSLCNVLDQPIEHRYRLQDPGVSWHNTLARQLKGRQLMLVKVAAPMEQDPTIDSSDNHLNTAASKTSPVHETVGNLSLDRQYLAELPTMSGRGSAMNYWQGRNDARFGAMIQNGVTRPQTLNLAGSNGCIQNPQDRVNYNGMDVDSQNNLDISNVHIFANEKMNISPIRAMKLQNISNRRALREKTALNESTSSNQLSSANRLNCESITEQKMVESDSEKALNVGTVEELEGSNEYRQCFSDIEGNWENDGDYKDPGEFIVDNMDIPEYQDGSTSSDSMTHLKQFAQEGQGFGSPVCNSPEQLSLDDSITQAKQAAFYVISEQSQCSDGSQCVKYSRSGNVFAVTGQMMNLKEWEASNSEGISMVNGELYRNGSSMSVQEDFATGQWRNDLDSNGNTKINDSFNTPVYSSGIEGDFIDTDGDKYELQRNTDECQSLPPYLDFNNYPQTSRADGDSLGQLDSCTRCKVVQDIPKRRPTLGQFRSSQNQDNTPSACFNDVKQPGYEKLNLTPPADQELSYEQNLEQAISDTSPDIPTIADAFTPMEDKFRLQDFESSGSLSSCSSQSTSPSLKDSSKDSSRQKRPTQSAAFSVTAQKKTRHNVSSGSRSSGSSGQHVHFEDQDLDLTHSFDSYSENADHALNNFPPMTQQQNSNSQRRSQNSPPTSSWKPALPPRTSRISFKHVMAGTSSRQSLDSLLANDKLFSHYNATLRNCCGWCPKETDNTICKTMSAALTEDGNYILWYSRTKKNLVLSISYGGTLLHYRIHTKVQGGQLTYYIHVSTGLFANLQNLLEYYGCHGIRVPSKSDSDGHSKHRAFMICPVKVEYTWKDPVCV